MERERQTVAEQEKRELVASLRRLLDAQLAAGRGGNFTRVEQLGERANAVVEAIVQRGGIVRTQADGGHDLEKLYGDLILLLRSQQADVQSRLRQLRRVKRAVGAYGGNNKNVKKPSTQLG
ncbi:MAG: hypothetical protein ABFE13_01880 [Phycisphaerales bacterium]